MFQFLIEFNTIGGAGATSRYGSGSDQMMRLRNTAFAHYCFEILTLLVAYLKIKFVLLQGPPSPESL
jgi:hypothetical protein